MELPEFRGPLCAWNGLPALSQAQPSLPPTRVARWWLPESFAFITEVPKTSVGKFDKKVLRARHAEGGLGIVMGRAPSRASG